MAPMPSFAHVHYTRYATAFPVPILEKQNLSTWGRTLLLAAAYIAIESQNVPELLQQKTYQVSYKAQVGHREDGCQHIEPHAVERRHIDDHKVHVDGTHHYY